MPLWNAQSIESRPELRLGICSTFAGRHSLSRWSQGPSRWGKAWCNRVDSVLS